MCREIVVKNLEGNHKTLLIHRYNTREDTFIEYYFIQTLGKVYRNRWVASGFSDVYNKKKVI